MNIFFFVMVITIIFIAAMVGIFVFIWKFVRKKENKRANTMRQFAAQSGYRLFVADTNILNLQRLRKFFLFRCSLIDTF